ncbi:MAG TPA: zinc-binding alcohol dehydrogenase [Nitrospiraceae bacterium]|jgi:NADPH:quinone reductase-like Zn-dependent oxidoreductase|nr:zinc-binding alcohol dehydrogenase [Nitrospiraceae bacterium]
MKAAVIDKYGGNDMIEVKDVLVPSPGPHEVLIRVRAAAINPLDWKIRYGGAKILTGSKFPKILGSECAGEVMETGRKVKHFNNGDQVIGYPGIRRLSAFAEYVCASEQTTFSKPKNITFEQASALPIAGLTALQSLRDLGHIARDSRVLINGASGGVGTFAIQIGKIFEANITAVCSGTNADLVKGLGADRVIDYTQKDFLESGEHYDIIFDAVSKRSFGECKKALAPTGIYVNTLPSLSVLLNQFLMGFFVRKKAKSVMVKPNATDMEWMKMQIEARKISIVIDRVYSLEQVSEALAYSETEKAKGKVILSL